MIKLRVIILPLHVASMERKEGTASKIWFDGPTNANYVHKDKKVQASFI